MAIKAFFGPWGRALEAAGIKPPRSDDRAAKRAEKRAAQKQKRKEFRNKTEERGKEVGKKSSLYPQRQFSLSQQWELFR
jgi:hypothetical protein